MSQIADQELCDVPQTLLATVYVRALEAQRPDALLRDEKAVAIVAQAPAAFEWIKHIRIDKEDQAGIILRHCELDRYARDFLARYADAVVVDLGCGLSARFDRVDNGSVEWYDLDLPEVIQLRRRFIGGEGPRHHFLGGSAFDAAWLDTLEVLRERPFLFIAEGVFQYFETAQVKSLVLALRERLPGSELVFDAFSPLIVRTNNLRFMLSGQKLGARFHFALKDGTELERWGPGIHLLDEWLLFDRPEPRLANARWMRHIPLLARPISLYHYRLGEKVA